MVLVEQVFAQAHHKPLRTHLSAHPFILEQSLIHECVDVYAYSMCVTDETHLKSSHHSE